VEWARITRRSFWKSLADDVLLPLAPACVRRPIVAGRTDAPLWLRRRIVRQHGVRYRMGAWNNRSRLGQHGRFYESVIARHLSGLATVLPTWSPLPGIDVRHPLLFLPLVEFILRLPVPLRVSPSCSKPVMREAMRGIVPEVVRLRLSKGILTPRICWAFAKERAFIADMLAQPVLGDLGIIEPNELLAAVDEAASGTGTRVGQVGLVYAVLSLETWLSTRVGRRMIKQSERSEENIHAETATRGADRPERSRAEEAVRS